MLFYSRRQDALKERGKVLAVRAAAKIKDQSFVRITDTYIDG